MITHDQILPSVYHLQRQGMIGDLKICALNSAPLRELAESPAYGEAFPGQGFEALPSLDTDPGEMYPDLYKEVIASLPRESLVIAAVPDHFHYTVIREALEADQHVLTVKPLVLAYEQAVEIDELARGKGLFVGVEYHKRFDRRCLEARGKYHAGRFGAFRCGQALLIEPWYYRHSNFQNWFTCENTDPFTYIGCHYVDLTYFVTGLKPTEVSVHGVKGKFPNGNEGYMWTTGSVRFENGALLSVVNGMGYPDMGAGTNHQGMILFGEGDDVGTIIEHQDQYRGVSHGYVDDAVGAHFRYVNPDYMRLVPWDGDGLKPVGYGFESIEANVHAALRVKGAGDLAAKQAAIGAIDAKGIVATPGNSWVNELVTEAARHSVLNDGVAVGIEYGKKPGIRVG